LKEREKEKEREKKYLLEIGDMKYIEYEQNKIVMA
jgi:hypothetical protein